MKISNIKFHSSWDFLIAPETKKKYFKELVAFVSDEQKHSSVYPPEDLIFHAFYTTGFEAAKVVILGQDPYHGKGQAHGLCFSVPEGIVIPRSLKNIYKEIQSDLGIPVPHHGNLEKWASQGVLLLNTILSVRDNQPKSHHKQGWEVFTDEVIRKLSAQKEHMVFMLWGNDAQSKAGLIDASKHLMLTAAHPSPLSASRGFFGCRHFSRANEYLEKNDLEGIDWRV
jgi:uracil-DNA glycosylase